MERLVTGDTYYGTEAERDNNTGWVNGDIFWSTDTEELAQYLFGAWRIMTTKIKAADSPSVDAFGRWRVSNAINVFDAQFTYGLQPLIFEQLTTGSGASIAHDATERAALMTFSSTPTGGQAYMQSYDWFRYQPGNSQMIMMTFNFREHVANTTKFVGYGDLANNGIQFISDGSGFAWRILSDTTAGDETVAQASWNLDPMDGTGNSGLTLDVTKTQIAVIDFQALYVGRVRVGFDIAGEIVYCHEFLHANFSTHPYLQTASLPLIAGMTCTGTVSTTMLFVCSTVKSEGGTSGLPAYSFCATSSVTAGNGTQTHAISIRPKTTFKSLVNRVKFELDTIEVIVTGNNSVKWELVVGQALTSPSFTDANATYSAMEYDTAGTLSGSPAIVLAAGYTAATNQSSTPAKRQVETRYPITLDAAGAVRALGTLGLLVTGLGGTSAVQVSLNWKEIR